MKTKSSEITYRLRELLLFPVWLLKMDCTSKYTNFVSNFQVVIKAIPNIFKSEILNICQCPIHNSALKLLNTTYCSGRFLKSLEFWMWI